MNKEVCKRYLTKAYKRIEKDNKSLNEKNIEYELRNLFDDQIKEYIAYSKIALCNMKRSGNLEITLKDLLLQIDTLPRIYNTKEAIKVANQL